MELESNLADLRALIFYSVLLLSLLIQCFIYIVTASHEIRQVLHYMLVDPPVAIVGISNWALDSSKMNRAVCLQRPEPSINDFMMTSREIIEGESSSQQLSAESEAPPEQDNDTPPPSQPLRRQNSFTVAPWLVSLARTFHELYTNQKAILSSHRDLIGMRDYYALLKHVRAGTSTGLGGGMGQLTLELLCEAVFRNFGAKPSSLAAILGNFVKSCLPDEWAGLEASIHTMGLTNSPQYIPRIKLIVDNLASASAAAASSGGGSSGSVRHLMILSSGGGDAALHLMFGRGVISEETADVLVGSRFKDDLHELHLIQQINQVRASVYYLQYNRGSQHSLYLCITCMSPLVVGQEDHGRRSNCGAAEPRCHLRILVRCPQPALRYSNRSRHWGE